ncbi:uncharacterized protein BX664DRAFT_320071 [Halteromyces radiatus]|uniref:uncharacterized protein n=1 Tax=Halteromyces radiatus TaxID=101107 RepID=UPI00221F2C3D|nr:uncharacterized protein BX664DRAFT_320071 [Halteromyces radiatus]KAI8098969.1 hypothetical protein BX664DRAFT_320071 [Halteromyces radiatus]
MSIVNIVRSRKENLASLLDKHSSSKFFLTFGPQTKEGTWALTQRQNNHPSPLRLLILDSSFNPPTRAHHALLSNTLNRQRKDFDAALLLLSSRNADKQLNGASVMQRMQMMEIIARQDEFKHFPVYVGLTSEAKFVDKAMEVQHWYQQQHTTTRNVDMELHFILGFDTVTRLFDPKYYHPLSVQHALDPFFKNCFLICADRSGNNDDDDDVSNFWNSSLVRGYAHRMTRISLDNQDLTTISSTLARQAAATAGLEPQSRLELKRFLDEDIVNYILDEKLYQ